MARQKQHISKCLYNKASAKHAHFAADSNDVTVLCNCVFIRSLYIRPDIACI